MNFSHRVDRGLPLPKACQHAIHILLIYCYTAIMKATVTMNSRGVITLPAKLRQALGLKADDNLIAETTPEGLLLRPAVTLPIEMYTQEREREFDTEEADLAEFLDGDKLSGTPLRTGSKAPR